MKITIKRSAWFSLFVFAMLFAFRFIPNFLHIFVFSYGYSFTILVYLSILSAIGAFGGALIGFHFLPNSIEPSKWHILMLAIVHSVICIFSPFIRLLTPLVGGVSGYEYLFYSIIISILVIQGLSRLIHAKNA